MYSFAQHCGMERNIGRRKQMVHSLIFATLHFGRIVSTDAIEKENKRFAPDSKNRFVRRSTEYQIKSASL